MSAKLSGNQITAFGNPSSSVPDAAEVQTRATKTTGLQCFHAMQQSLQINSS
jgi:hypothetical protein